MPQIISTALKDNNKAKAKAKTIGPEVKLRPVFED